MTNIKNLIDRDKVEKIFNSYDISSTNWIREKILSLPIESQWIDVKTPPLENWNYIVLLESWTVNSCHFSEWVFSETMYEWIWKPEVIKWQPLPLSPK